MRFTRIPLIATLLAGALSLLVVLPAIAQSTQGIETDGRLSVAGAFEVQVYQNIEDIRTRGAAAGAAAAAVSATDAIVPFAAGTSEPAGTVGRGNHPLGLTDIADDATDGNDYIRVPDPRNTLFNRTLYVSNDKDAYNTILITASVPDTAGASALTTRTNRADDPATTEVNEAITDGWTGRLTGAMYDCAQATVKNTRSGESADIVLFRAANRGATVETVYQGILAVRDRGEESGRVDELDSTCVNKPVGDPLIVTDNEAPPWSVANSTTNQPAAVIPARDGDTIEITVEGVQGRLTLTVDGDEPSVSNPTPEHKGTQDSSRVTLGFTVSDDGAGLRFDAEDGSSGDGDSSPANGDNDQNYNEPLTVVGGNGATDDIKVYYNAGGLTDAVVDVDGDDATQGLQYTASEEFSRYGNNAWTQVSFGRTYRLGMILNSQEFNTKYEWQVTVKDRVGNAYTTDADSDKDGDQPFTFALDDEDPEISEVRTGVMFDASSNPPKEKADRSWIALSISNKDAGGPDRVDRSSVQASDFTVSGATVVDAVVPTNSDECDPSDDPDTNVDETANDIKDIDGVCGFDPRARIYLQLAEELEADQKPTIQVLGGVFMDVAGNTNVVQSKSGSSQITDKIAPRVSITVTASGDATNRPATDEDGEFTIRVTSDEDLARFPKVWLATINGVEQSGAAGVAGTLGVAALYGYTPTEKERNVWERTIQADDSNIPGSGQRLLAVLVNAEDEDGNKGNSAGWKLARPSSYPTGEPQDGVYDHDSDVDTAERPETPLDFQKLHDGGYLIEVDDANLAAPTVRIQPPIEGAPKATESATPYLEITFGGEKQEYGVANRSSETDAAPVFYKADAGDDDPINTDSHSRIRLTKLTVGGEDRLADARVVSSNAGQFILAFVAGLPVGKYDVIVSATDDVGNELATNSAGDKEFKYTFEVRERAGYKVSLRPGWNLISWPGTPTNPAVGAVMGSLQADTVLSYQDGEWLSAIRSEGEWRGTLEQIVGGYGYWVQTTAAETITTVIPPTLPNQVLPTVPITSGWNLVGVIDPEQKKVGTEAVQDPDKYFVNVSWRVAYSFDTQSNRWGKILPKPSTGTDDGTNDGMIKNGSGYWLWSTEPGTLVP